MHAAAARDRDAEALLIRATLRMNTLIFGAILGLMTGMLLFALAVAASLPPLAPMRLPVVLLSVFLPGYAANLGGAVAGFGWGCVAGGLIGAAVYWVNARAALSALDRVVEVESRGADFPTAAVRLHGPSLGFAIGAIGAAGLFVATNWLVLRGTAAESIHARLLSQVLPGYQVDFTGSLVGACELFALLFAFCLVFAWTYNRLAAARDGLASSSR